MVRSILVGVLTVLSLTAHARAQDQSGSSFDGAAGAAIGLPPGAFSAARAAAAADAAAAAVPPSRQSGADLYSFTRAEAQAARRRLGFNERDANTAGLVFDRDVPADVQSQMRADLAFMAGLQGSDATPLHRRIFGAMDGAAYARFFNERVAAVGMNDCGSAKAVACVIPFLNSSKMWLTQNFLRFNHPQVSRMMIVYHESRHTEVRNDNWPHDTCPTPFKDARGRDVTSIWTGSILAGEPACDSTPFGSYGSSTILLKNIQKFCTNCTDKVKMDAGLYADDQLGRITDTDAKAQMVDDFNR